MIDTDAPASVSRRMSPYVIAILIALPVLAGFLIWRQWFETYHYAVVDEGVLYRDGNRGPREFANALRKARPKTVVCLIDDNELNDREKPEFQAEMDLLKQRGIACERIRIPLGGWPTSADVNRFLSIATDKSRQPVLVHCAQGVRRTGMLVAAYQESVLGYDDERAKREILRFGHSERSIGDVKRFIDNYDLKTRQVMAQLEMSKE